MNKILVTGATGKLGQGIVEHLLDKVPAGRIAAMARKAEDAAGLAARGVNVRQADYFEPAALRAAMQGVEQVFLVSAVAFSDRVAQHANVIAAAKAAGVRHLFYTSIMRKPGVHAEIDSVTDHDIATEALLRASGIGHTVVFHPLYMDELPKFLNADALQQGPIASAGGGRVPYALRKELAEAAAELLSRGGPAPAEVWLNSGYSYSMGDVAVALSLAAGKALPYHSVDTPAYIAMRVAEGVPEPVAGFIAQWFSAFEQGAFDVPSRELEQLLGRKPQSLEAGLKALYGAAG